MNEPASSRTILLSLLLLSPALLATACDQADDDGVGDDLGAETDGDDDGDSDGGDDGDDGGLDTNVVKPGEGWNDDGEVVACFDHGSEDDCVADDGCKPAYGAPLLEDEGSWCTANEEYIGCVDAGDLCPPLTATLCGPGGQIWQATGCTPVGVQLCEPPGDVVGPC